MLMEINTIAAETRAVEYLQDNYQDFFTPQKVSQERRTFDLPKSIWWTMFSSYAVFFTAITIAMGRDRSALFMIVISACYTVMYFGTAAVLNSVATSERPATVPGDIETATGNRTFAARTVHVVLDRSYLHFLGKIAHAKYPLTPMSKVSLHGLSATGVGQFSRGHLRSFGIAQ
ncbi:hypothetical protein [Sphingorhabdus sp.]|uniref:hypothetical protein n=1 Tax=Sphingorhabdus sp. TaxID=1902408 RepID=UPI003593EC80